jgi:hypothetical protein
MPNPSKLKIKNITKEICWLFMKIYYPQLSHPYNNNTTKAKKIEQTSAKGPVSKMHSLSPLHKLLLKAILHRKNGNRFRLIMNMTVLMLNMYPLIRVALVIILDENLYCQIQTIYPLFNLQWADSKWRWITK